MSLASTYVRGRDGALYKNPVISFPEGFVCFDESEPPELVLWLPSTPHEKTPDGDVARAVLDRVFRFPEGVGFATVPHGGVACNGRSDRVIPGTDPLEFRPAIAFSFNLAGRIPRPVFHEGTERHASRLGRAAVYDFPATAYDALQLDVPVLEEGGQS